MPDDATSPVEESAAPSPAVEVRPLRSPHDYQECLRLQRETWGESFGEAVPPSILKVVQRVGGIAAGAFDAHGRMLGFVFGITGVEEGRIVHWSDMLAVRGEARDLGIGRLLKEYQRDALLPLGVERIYWTYDPLVARNAHLNFNRLGVEAVEYVQDMYGESDSVLHRGVGTDRFVVAWRIRDPDAAPSPDPAPWSDAPLANPFDGEVLDAPAAPRVRVEIPPDLHAVMAASMEEAARWRAGSRAAFQAYLGYGYRVAGFHRDPESGRCYYLLSHP